VGEDTTDDGEFFWKLSTGELRSPSEPVIEHIALKSGLLKYEPSTVLRDVIDLEILATIFERT
jgi:hypothetical protein